VGWKALGNEKIEKPPGKGALVVGLHGSLKEASFCGEDMAPQGRGRLLL
jgi:hypothetical protein